MWNEAKQKYVCDTCGSDKKVELEPSSGSLIFGPFPGSMSFGTQSHINFVHRCAKCDKKLSKKLESMLK